MRFSSHFVDVQPPYVSRKGRTPHPQEAFGRVSNRPTTSQQSVVVLCYLGSRERRSAKKGKNPLFTANPHGHRERHVCIRSCVERALPIATGVDTPPKAEKVGGVCVPENDGPLRALSIVPPAVDWTL